MLCGVCGGKERRRSRREEEEKEEKKEIEDVCAWEGKFRGKRKRRGERPMCPLFPNQPNTKKERQKQRSPFRTAIVPSYVLAFPFDNYFLFVVLSVCFCFCVFHVFCLSVCLSDEEPTKGNMGMRESTTCV